MSQPLTCQHGHQLSVPNNPSGPAEFTCPLCGADVRDRGNRDTDNFGLAVMHVPQSATGSDLEKIATQNMSLEQLSELLEEDFPKSSGDETGLADISGTDADFALTMDFKPENQTPSADPPSGPSLTSKSPSNDKFTGDTPRGKTKNVLKPPAVSGVRVMEELGRGGMGVVYRAYDEKLKSEVAIKTLLRMGPDDLARFKHEFRGLSDIAHPNLASLYELHSDGTTWCLTMELLKGVEFLEYIWSELDALDAPPGHAPAALVRQITIDCSLAFSGGFGGRSISLSRFAGDRRTSTRGDGPCKSS